ncbi:MAG TPA: glycosyltransferase family 4 protein [Candidatus Limnocylindria bacterium]|nr:glycosyltransferase family 4 protein [Candidatus Limnocylindria bacterium]
MHVTFVGTWVPRRCGIATFTNDLVGAVRAADPTVRATVAAIDEPEAARRYGPEVVFRIRQGDPLSYRDAARRASGSDVVNVQHEFGLYGVHRDGRWEDHLVELLTELRAPVITTLHTVLPRPEPWMRDAVREISARSTSVVVMAHRAAELLRDVYGVKEAPLVIPHGVPQVTPGPSDGAKRRLGVEGRTVLSTFGLVDPRKGIEHAIRAMPEIVAADPTAIYLVVGQTHPELLKRHGEAYRNELIDLVRSIGMSDHVAFVDEYLPLDGVVEHLSATDVYVTPYLDPDQITSGTLAYALGVGKAVISTRYQHAVEALADGRGILVDFRSPEQIASAAVTLLRHPEVRQEIEERAYAYGRATTWPAVGRRVLEAMRAIAVPRLEQETIELAARIA